MNTGPSPGKPASASRLEAVHIVMPSDANVHGNAFGGMVMQWTDLAGAMAAMRHARLPVVTASVDQLSFLAPMRVGHIAVLRARVNAVFGTSMEVEVEVVAEDPETGVRVKGCDAFLTFVALGPDGRPTRIEPLLLENDDDHRREAEARERRSARLAKRSRHP
jgi:acyl-CoA hydrolase